MRQDGIRDEDDLSELLARGQARLRAGGIAEREPGVDHGINAAARDQS
jgi:hypothetical protein